MLWLALREACTHPGRLRARFSLDNTRVSNRLLLVVCILGGVVDEELDHGCCTCFVGSDQCRWNPRIGDDALERGSDHSSRAALAVGTYHSTSTPVALVTHHGSGTPVALVTHNGPGTAVALEVTAVTVGPR